MTTQLNRKQIDQLKALLIVYDLDVKPKRKVVKSDYKVVKSDYLSRIRAWTPMTPDGARCKASLLRLSKIPQFTHLREENT